MGGGGTLRGMIRVLGLTGAILIPMSANLSAFALSLAFLVFYVVWDFCQLHRKSVAGQAAWRSEKSCRTCCAYSLFC